MTAATNRPRRTRITKEEREQVYRTYGTCCWICHLEIPIGQRSVDHVKPVAAGGRNLLGNYRPAHKLCNSKRGKPRPVNGKYR